MSDTVLYGATGYTGRLVAAELKRLGSDFALAGRSIERLRRLSGELQVDVPLHAAPVGDPPALRRAFEGARCVINCAGPFTKIGKSVVEAAVETHTNYIDTTGEQQYIKSVFDTYSERAAQARVAVICAMGFDIVPADMGAQLAAAGLGRLDELTVAYSLEHMMATHGTVLSLMQVMGGSGLVYECSKFCQAPSVPRRRRVHFPDSLGKQMCISFPAGEIVTIPRHVDVEDLAVSIASKTVAPSHWLEGALPWLVPAASLALRTPLRALLQRAVTRLPKGPSEEQRKAATFQIVIEAKGTQGKRRGVISGSDVYGLTAISCAHAAQLIVDPSFNRSGVLAPAQAFEPESFLNYLGNWGLKVDRDWF